MHVILNSEPLEEVDCFKYLGSQVHLMEDVIGMWYTMKDTYVAWGALNRAIQDLG